MVSFLLAGLSGRVIGHLSLAVAASLGKCMRDRRFLIVTLFKVPHRQSNLVGVDHRPISNASTAIASKT
jgi:hypothetical protein